MLFYLFVFIDYMTFQIKLSFFFFSILGIFLCVLYISILVVVRDGTGVLFYTIRI